MSKRIRENEELSALIDSIENDDSIERKIDAFKQRKHRKRQSKKRITHSNTMRSANQPKNTRPVPSHLKESEDIGKTRVLKPTGMPSSHAGATTVFDPDAIQPSVPSNNETVVLDDNKIQTMIEEKQKTAPQRQVAAPAYEEPDPSPRLSRAQIVIIVLGVVCILFIVMGVVTYINSDGKIQHDETAENNSDYQALLSWAKKYDNLTESKKEDIIEYEDIYNNCSSEQQEKIDEVLKNTTGKTFNQLLAIAKSNKKSNTKNNNVKSAEKKAKLKKRISALQSQLTSAQNNLTNLQSAQSTVQNQIDQLTTQIQQAQQAVADAQTKLSDAQSKLSALQSNSSSDDEEDKSSEIKTAQSAVTEAQADYDKALKNSDVSSLQSQLDEYQQALNDYQSQIQQAQTEIDNLNTQVARLQSQLSDLD